jgi:hypothetical protein
MVMVMCKAERRTVSTGVEDKRDGDGSFSELDDRCVDHIHEPAAEKTA